MKSVLLVGLQVFFPALLPAFPRPHQSHHYLVFALHEAIPPPDVMLSSHFLLHIGKHVYVVPIKDFTACHRIDRIFEHTIAIIIYFSRLISIFFICHFEIIILKSSLYMKSFPVLYGGSIYIYHFHFS